MLLADIAEMFDSLRRINMKLNPKKCSFSVEEGNFLGYMVTSEGIRSAQHRKALFIPKDVKTSVLAHANIYNAILDKYVESLKLGKNGSAFIQDGTKSYPVGIVRDVEIHIGKLKLLNDFCVIDMKKDLETPLLVGRGFLATTNAVIDCRKAKIEVGEGITKSYKPRPSSDGIEWEIARDAEINPFKDVLVFRRMIEFLGALPINLKGNMWESEDLIENPIN
ncbi:MAK10-like protein [Tanacetum coccineum]